MTIESIFNDLPVLETERLFLRKLGIDDAGDLFAYASDPVVSRYTTWTPPASIDESRAFLESVVRKYHEHQVAPWGIVHKGDVRLIGTCGFVSWDIPNSRAEIAYALSRSYWNHDYMTEAVQAVLSFGFLMMHLERIEARCIPENLPSSRVMEKAGMSYEGTLRDHLHVKGEFRTLNVYSISRKEWEA